MIKDFEYLKTNEIYLDNACQSLRPSIVIDSIVNYYQNHNSCGERVKYTWGITTDKLVKETRELVLSYLKLSKKDYFVSFTLNTTYGLNLVLNQLKPALVSKVMTSDIEHNSVFLSTLNYAKNNNLSREVMERESDGSIKIANYDFTKALVVVNSVSNIDGRQLNNLKDLVKAVHKGGGIIFIDAAQSMVHGKEILEKTQADLICFSAHKMYAPSLGGLVVKKHLIAKINLSFIGGGMVDDVGYDQFKLSYLKTEHIHTIFESGLQAFGEIIALGTALKWLMNIPKATQNMLKENSQLLYDFLANHDKIVLINESSTPVLSFYLKGIDSHLLGKALADEGIMARTGYFCCHYYLDYLKKYPPLIRFSLGYQTSRDDILKVISILERCVS